MNIDRFRTATDGKKIEYLRVHSARSHLFICNKFIDKDVILFVRSPRTRSTYQSRLGICDTVAIAAWVIFGAQCRFNHRKQCHTLINTKLVSRLCDAHTETCIRRHLHIAWGRNFCAWMRWMTAYTLPNRSAPSRSGKFSLLNDTFAVLGRSYSRRWLEMDFCTFIFFADLPGHWISVIIGENRCDGQTPILNLI